MNQISNLSTISSSPALASPPADWRIAIISAQWHSDIVHQARNGAITQLQHLGLASHQLSTLDVPGAFELPLIARKLALSGKVDAVIACALIVDGGIYRHDFVSASVVDGLMQVQLNTGVPVFSVALTPHNFQPGLALEGFFHQHFLEKGKEAADTCVQTLRMHAQMDDFLAA